VLLRSVLDPLENRKPRFLELPDPSGLDLVDRYWVQVVELASAISHRGDQIRGLQELKVLAD
jgi:hypothetical protein